MMNDIFYIYYTPGFSCSLRNLKKPSNIASIAKISYFGGANKVTQVTWIFCNILPTFSKMKMTTWQSLLVAWLDTLGDKLELICREKIGETRKYVNPKTRTTK
jgi:hypothetical protein